MSAQNVPASGENHAEVAIFWDSQTVQLPPSANAVDVSKAIVDSVSSYGRIVDRRLYFDISSAHSADGSTVWDTFDATGFDLINIPRRQNQKNTLHKKVMADILTFAWDSAVRNQMVKPCVVLVTSDGDFAYEYTFSKLRDRGVTSVVICGTESAATEVLKQNADKYLSLTRDVVPGMGQLPVAPSLPSAVAVPPLQSTIEVQSSLEPHMSFQLPPLGNIELPPLGNIDLSLPVNTNSSSSNNIEPIGPSSQHKPNGNGTTAQPPAPPPGLKTKAPPQNQQMPNEVKPQPDASSSTKGSDSSARQRSSSSQANGKKENGTVAQQPPAVLELVDKDAMALHEIVRKLGESPESRDGGWIRAGDCARKFRNAIPRSERNNVADRYRKARDLSITNGALLRGRLWLNGKYAGTMKILSNTTSGYNLKLYSADDYLRVTDSNFYGEQDNEQSHEGGKSNRDASMYSCTKLVVQNLPKSTRTTELLRYLEQEHNITVVRGSSVQSSTNGPSCIRIEMKNEEDAMRVLELASYSMLKFRGRSLEVAYDEEYQPPLLTPLDAFARPPPVSSDYAAKVWRGDNVAVLCEITLQYMSKPDTRVLPGGWVHGGSLAHEFNVLGGEGFSSFHRFNKAREEALEKNFMEVGRRPKTAEHLGQIEVVLSLHNSGYYTPELYLRLTPNGLTLAQSS